jgi:hypothetical protein
MMCRDHTTSSIMRSLPWTSDTKKLHTMVSAKHALGMELDRDRIMYKKFSQDLQRGRDLGVNPKTGKKGRRNGRSKSKHVKALENAQLDRRQREWFDYLDACKREHRDPIGVSPSVLADWKKHNDEH